MNTKACTIQLIQTLLNIEYLIEDHFKYSIETMKLMYQIKCGKKKNIWIFKTYPKTDKRQTCPTLFKPHATGNMDIIFSIKKKKTKGALSLPLPFLLCIHLALLRWQKNRYFWKSINVCLDSVSVLSRLNC